VISNSSTGELGLRLAGCLQRSGAKVTVILGPATYLAKGKGYSVIRFNFYDELFTLIKRDARKCDILIHAAAVSDYKTKGPLRTKLASGKRNLRLDLVPTAKIIDKIKRLNPRVILVGFKLEHAGCDLVVANQLSKGRYQGYLINQQGKVIAQANTRQGMAVKLTSALKSYC
jgi:phosphopantothenoylcysteine decarboxylase/phosphopantothenate--cysteine ligase